MRYSMHLGELIKLSCLIMYDNFQFDFETLSHLFPVNEPLSHLKYEVETSVMGS